MRRLTALCGMLAALSASLASGCTVLLAPDRDAIVRSFDAGPEAGLDAGPEAGPDAGPICRQVEVSCADGVDNDCDGFTDCEDPNCATDAHCCSVSGDNPWLGLGDYSTWRPYPAVNSVRATSETLKFGTGGGPQQAINNNCAPLAFGLQVGVTFVVRSARTDDGDFASLVFSPVSTPSGAGTLLADLALRVSHDTAPCLERAGAVIGCGASALAPGTHSASIELRPSVDEAARPVLTVSASIGTTTLAEEAVVMPLSDLVGPELGCGVAGLFLAAEGHGIGVELGAVSAGTGNCSNPAQFLDDAAGPLGEAMILAPGAWRAGGAGEPALLMRSSSGVSNRIDLLVDAAATERADELLRFVDFSIGGAIRSASAWGARLDMGVPELVGPTPSSREPAMAYAPERVLVFAEEGMPNIFSIRQTTLPMGQFDGPGTPVLLLDAATVTECTSLRDPAVVGLGDHLLLLFTCERAGGTPTIGAARFENSGTGYTIVSGSLVHNLLTGDSLGAYAQQGVTSPEVVVASVSGDNYSLRVWFLARSAGGETMVALAYGDLDASASGALPSLQVYPGNPVLRAEDPILGGACPLGCTINSLGVAVTEGVSSLWGPDPISPSYIFLVERTRFRAGGVGHQLIPLRQPQPDPPRSSGG